MSWTTVTSLRAVWRRWEATALMVRPQEMPTLIPSCTSSTTRSAPARPSSSSRSVPPGTSMWTTRASASPKRSSKRRASSDEVSRGSWIAMVTNPASLPRWRSLATVGRDSPIAVATSAWLKPRSKYSLTAVTACSSLLSTALPRFPGRCPPASCPGGARAPPPGRAHRARPGARAAHSTRSRTTPRSSGALSPIPIPPSSDSRARGMRHSSSVCSVSRGCPLLTRWPGLACSSIPAPA